MSSFDTLESGVETSRPIEVYRFDTAATSYGYCSTEDIETVITLGSQDYNPEPIAHSELVYAGTESARQITVTVPATNTFVQIWRLLTPSEVIGFTLIRLQRDESPSFNTQQVIYKGQVTNVQFPDDGETAEIEITTIEDALGGQMPAVTYIGQCQWTLGGTDCGVNMALFNHIGNVSAQSGAVVTLDGAAASLLDFVGGYLTPTAFSEPRMIIAQSGNDLTLLLPLSVDITGTNAQAFAGCDHDPFGDCINVFNNGINTGGFPFVPTRNPVEKGL